MKKRGGKWGNSLDWRARGAELACQLPAGTMDEVLREVKTLLAE